jgi:hypothetical protein
MALTRLIDEDIKTTIESLVWKYESNGGSVVPWSADIVKGKGEGQIFLLHGAPGVGKTCTAGMKQILTPVKDLHVELTNMQSVSPNSQIGRSYHLHVEIWVPHLKKWKTIWMSSSS